MPDHTVEPQAYGRQPVEHALAGGKPIHTCDVNDPRKVIRVDALMMTAPPRE